jgi:hypothetical protein
MGAQKRRLGLKKETLLTLGSLDAAALARVVGGSGTTLAGGGGDVFATTSAHSLSGSRKC